MARGTLKDNFGFEMFKDKKVNLNYLSWWDITKLSKYSVFESTNNEKTL